MRTRDGIDHETLSQKAAAAAKPPIPPEQALRDCADLLAGINKGFYGPKPYLSAYIALELMSNPKGRRGALQAA